MQSFVNIDFKWDISYLIYQYYAIQYPILALNEVGPFITYIFSSVLAVFQVYSFLVSLILALAHNT